jgi:hypothetical protein
MTEITKRRSFRLTAAAVTGVVATAVLATPAYAASVSCSLSGNGYCYTAVLTATSSHKIKVTATRGWLVGTTASIYDIDTGRDVGEINSGLLSSSKTISGLYGRYQIFCSADDDTGWTGGRCSMSNA